jgi:hypothetical protein
MQIKLSYIMDFVQQHLDETLAMPRRFIKKLQDRFR